MNELTTNYSVLRNEYERCLGFCNARDYQAAARMLVELVQQISYISAGEKEEQVAGISRTLSGIPADSGLSHATFLYLIARLYGIRKPDGDNTRRLLARLQDIGRPMYAVSHHYLRA